jgi:hypothetical protein
MKRKSDHLISSVPSIGGALIHCFSEFRTCSACISGCCQSIVKHCNAIDVNHGTSSEENQSYLKAKRLQGINMVKESKLAANDTLRVGTDTDDTIIRRTCLWGVVQYVHNSSRVLRLQNVSMIIQHSLQRHCTLSSKYLSGKSKDSAKSGKSTLPRATAAWLTKP